MDTADAPKISNTFKYESSLWSSRNLKGSATLDLETFDQVLNEISNLLCDLGITATVFDGESNQVYQKTVGNAMMDSMDIWTIRIVNRLVGVATRPWQSIPIAKF